MISIKKALALLTSLVIPMLLVVGCAERDGGGPVGPDVPQALLQSGGPPGLPPD